MHKSPSGGSKPGALSDALPLYLSTNQPPLSVPASSSVPTSPTVPGVPASPPHHTPPSPVPLPAPATPSPTILNTSKAQDPDSHHIENLELSCWLNGESMDNIFAVRIEKSKRVWCLQAKVKEEMGIALQHVKFSSLIIWKIENPVSLEKLNEDHVKNLEHGLNGSQKLSGRQLISEIWPSQPSTSHLHIVVHLPPTNMIKNITTKIRSQRNTEALLNSVLNFIPWIAALYFVIKSLQASSAQAYANMVSNPNMPEYMVGKITNLSTAENLMDMADMVNFPSLTFMGIFAGAGLVLIIICHLVFTLFIARD